MDHKINIMGIHLYNYYVKDSSCLIDEYLNNDCMNVVDIIQLSNILKASENTALKKAIEDMDFTVIADEIVLEAAGIREEQRMEEVRQNVFLEECFDKVIRKKNTVYLLCDTEEMLEEFHKYLLVYKKDLIISGKFSLEKTKGEDDSIVNEINSAAPDVILAVLKTPLRQEFVIRNRNKFSAKLWLGLGDDLTAIGVKSSKGTGLWTLIEKEIFRSKAKKYVEEKGD